MSNSNNTVEKKKLSFAEMAAAGTSITISKMPIVQENHAKPTTTHKSSNDSNATDSTDGNSTSSISSSSLLSRDQKSSKTQVPTSVPKPASAPAKNPWKIDVVKKELEDSKSAGLGKDAPTPAESKDMKPVTVEIFDKKMTSSDKKEKSEIRAKANKNSTGSTKNNVKKNRVSGPNTEALQRQDTSSSGDKEKKKPSQSRDAGNKEKDGAKKKEASSLADGSKKQSTEDRKHKSEDVPTSTGQNNNQRGKSNQKKSGAASGNNHKKNSNQNKKSTKSNAKKKQNKHKSKTQKKKNQINTAMYIPSPKELAAFKKAAIKQIEYFFSTDELVKNIYMRKQMDVEGYLPAAVVFNFPSVLSYCVPYYELLEELKSSDVVEVDTENECLRLKGGEEVYKKWLFPSADGTLGCPKWLIPKVEQEDGEEKKEAEIPVEKVFDETTRANEEVES